MEVVEVAGGRALRPLGRTGGEATGWARGYSDDPEGFG